MVAGTNSWLAQAYISGGATKSGVTRDDLSQRDAIGQHQNPRGYKIGRTLPADLLASSRAAKQSGITMSPKVEKASSISDLPRILRRVILELKPEWATLGLNVKPLPTAANGP